MEDNNFWDELAKRLRQEQPQPFPEDDWAAVHTRLRVQGKRRNAWFWPGLVCLLFLANNLIWWLLWPQTLKTHDQAEGTVQRDTVFLIRERTIPDTVWQRITPAPVFEHSSMPARHSGSEIMAIPSFSKTVMDVANGSDSAERLAVPALIAVDTPGETASQSEPDPAFMPLPLSGTVIEGPTRLLLVSVAPVPAAPSKRSPTLFIETDAGRAWFLPQGASKAYTQQIGASLYVMPGKWGAVAGLRHFSAFENPAQTDATLGVPDDCENCPAIGYPDRVRVKWLEFQLGLTYRLPLSNGKTSLFATAMGQVRGRANQYRHFHFETYGGPPIDVEDRYKQKSGLYWNGWTGKITAVHRLKGSLGLYGALEGRWPSGVQPRLTPPALGLNAGLAWYFRN